MHWDRDALLMSGASGLPLENVGTVGAGGFLSFVHCRVPWKRARSERLSNECKKARSGVSISEGQPPQMTRLKGQPPYPLRSSVPKRVTYTQATLLFTVSSRFSILLRGRIEPREVESLA